MVIGTHLLTSKLQIAVHKSQFTVHRSQFTDHSSQMAQFIGIARHRLQTDGKGVTTLAAFHGCPLRCRYCLNPQCNRADSHTIELSPQELYDRVMIDQLYFLATGGGVTFGGGEPALHSKFITEFRQLCGPEWNLTLESSLNVPKENVQKLLPVIDHYIIDLKDTNDNIYQRYTQTSNVQVKENLEWLVAQGKADRIIVRLPHIPDFNTEEDIQRSKEYLEHIGVRSIDVFTYITDIKK